jgi:hypothetical protein
MSPAEASACLACLVQALHCPLVHKFRARGLSLWHYMLSMRVILFWVFHMFSIIQLNKRILLVLVWLSGTDFTVPDLVGAPFAKADYRMLGTAYSSGSCKLAAALPQKSVRTVFQLTSSYYYYALVCIFFLFLSYICHYLS